MTQTKSRFSPTLPGGTLYPFQVESLTYLWEHQGRAIIGDTRGIGKTVQALAWLHHNPGLRPAVIVVPANIKLQWFRELQRWLEVRPEEITVLTGRKSQAIPTPYVIVNYDILKNHLKALKDVQPQIVILDECQRTKSPTAARSKASRELTQHPSVRSVVGLTGTMFLNRPKEGWHQALVVNPTVFPNWWRYAQRYCSPTQKTFYVKGEKIRNPETDALEQPTRSAWDFSGASHTDELAAVLKKKVLIRRTKEEVFPDLPRIQRSTIPFQCDLKEYLKLQDQARRKLKEIRNAMRQRRVHWERLSEPEMSKAIANQAEADSMVKLYGMAIAEISLLRHSTGVLKVPHVVEWASDFLESQDPLLIFGHHHDVMDALVEQLERQRQALRGDDIMGQIPPPLDGRMPQRIREAWVLAFQEGVIPIVIAGTSAMGEGYDGLQHAASHLSFTELGWNRAAHDQAEGRLDRGGQTKPVNSYYLVAVDTIDDQMIKVLDAKNNVTSASYGEIPPPGVIEAIMDEIIEGG